MIVNRIFISIQIPTVSLIFNSSSQVVILDKRVGNFIYIQIPTVSLTSNSSSQVVILDKRVGKRRFVFEFVPHHPKTERTLRCGGSGSSGSVALVLLQLEALGLWAKELYVVH
jgi:hypothetical protein